MVERFPGNRLLRPDRNCRRCLYWSLYSPCHPTRCQWRKIRPIKVLAAEVNENKQPILFCEIESYPDGSDYSYLTTLPDPERLPEEQDEMHEMRGLLLA